MSFLQTDAANDHVEALIWREQRLTYGWLRDLRDTIRDDLIAAGIRRGDVVVLEGDFSPAAIAALLALLDLAAITVPLTDPSRQTRQTVLEISRARHHVQVGVDDVLAIERLAGAQEHSLYTELRAAGNPGIVLFTSGSSGAPKGAVHDSTRLLSKFAVRRHCYRTLALLRFDHIGGLDTLFYSLSNRSCLVVPVDRSPDGVCSAIAGHMVEVLPASPSFLNLILLSEAYKRFDCSHLKVITYGAEAMPEHVLKRCSELFPQSQFLQKYGTTEFGALRSKSRSSDSVWLKIGGENVQTRVVDGILQIKTETSMLGYLNAPNPFTADGWLVTGDSVIQDGDYFRILGRKTDVINVGGEKVFPTEIENVVLQCPNVEQAAVFGEKHAIMGNIVVARVRLREAEDPKGFMRRLKAHCAALLEPYKVPVKILVTDAELLSPRQKIVRHAL